MTPNIEPAKIVSTHGPTMKIRMYVVIFHAQEPEEEDTFIIQEMRSSGSFCKLPKVIKLLSDRVLS